MRSVPLVRLPRAALGEARTFLRLDAVPSTEVLKGPALHARRRRIEWSRHLVQAGFLLTVLWIGWDFVRWVHEIHPVHPAGLVILVLVLGLGLLAKKAFCSWVCPIGTLSRCCTSSRGCRPSR